MMSKTAKYRRGIDTKITIVPKSGSPSGAAMLPHHTNWRCCAISGTDWVRSAVLELRCVGWAWVRCLVREWWRRHLVLGLDLELLNLRLMLSLHLIYHAMASRVFAVTATIIR